MPLIVVRRKSTGALTITGTVAGRRVRRRAQSDDPKLAAEEAAALEAKILRTAWHGERRGSRGFSEAVISYIDATRPSTGERRRLQRILLALGADLPLSEVDQVTVDRVRRAMLSRPTYRPRQ